MDVKKNSGPKNETTTKVGLRMHCKNFTDDSTVDNFTFRLKNAYNAHTHTRVHAYTLTDAHRDNIKR